MHLVEISKDSRPHYHKKTTEIYYVLEGEGHLEIDKDTVPLKPGVSVLIPPKSLHRAVGELKFSAFRFLRSIRRTNGSSNKQL